MPAWSAQTIIFLFRFEFSHLGLGRCELCLSEIESNLPAFRRPLAGAGHAAGFGRMFARAVAGTRRFWLGTNDWWLVAAPSGVWKAGVVVVSARAVDDGCACACHSSKLAAQPMRLLSHWTCPLLLLLLLLRLRLGN